jgi:hypothetical protein
MNVPDIARFRRREADVVETRIALAVTTTGSRT